MPIITTSDGCDLYVKDWGSGRPVVLIHGWPLNADSWEDQSVALAEAGYRVIAYDRRGFGRSAQPWGGYDYDRLADDLADILNAIDAHDATIVGFSMGGGEVARYLSRHGTARIAKAGLVASVVPFLLKTDDHPDGIDAAQFAPIKEGLRKDRAHFLANFLKDFFGVGWISSPVSQELLDAALATAMQASLRATLACVDAWSTTDFRPDLPAFTVPTLIIHGTDDKTVPIGITARAAAAAIPGSTLIEYQGAPHGLLATEKDRVIADLLAFLSA